MSPGSHAQLNIMSFIMQKKRRLDIEEKQLDVFESANGLDKFVNNNSGVIVLVLYCYITTVVA